MNRFATLKAFSAAVFEDADIRPVKIAPGPEIPDIPGRTVVWTPYGGPGLEVDGIFDGRGWQARCIGMQNNYESAEELAFTLDAALIATQSSKIGGVWVVSVQRVGGAPAALLVDNADRTHFVCSYIASVESALPN